MSTLVSRRSKGAEPPKRRSACRDGETSGLRGRGAPKRSPSFHIVAPVDLHVHDILLGVLLGVAAAFPDGVDDGLLDLRGHIPARPAKVQVAVLLVDQVVDELLLLLQSVGHVDLLLLLAAERQGDNGQRALLVVGVELVLVAVLDPVAGTEEQRHRRDLLALAEGGHTLLDEGAHRRDARAKAHHHEGRLMRLGHHDRGFVDLGRQAHAGASDLELLQPAGALADALPSALRLPIVPDDAEVALILAAHPRRRGDGVEARLDVGHVVDEVANGGHRAGELLQELGVGVALIDAVLVVLLPLAGADAGQLLLLLRVLGAELQHLVKAALGPAADVQALGEELAGRDVLGQGL
mmetsp:Transcript_121399/g.348832  ORF Transcript_121399/g.348832 Transcript_121399/m.348832 type:complete len:352 (+) Transcript_121399:251-1306(+)